MKIFTLFVLILVSISLKAQIDNNLRYEQKINRFETMKKAGNTLIGTGIGTSVIGGVILGAVMIENDGKTEEEMSVGSILGMYSGAIFLELGVDMIIGGVVLRKIAKHKIKFYQDKLKNFSYNIIYSENLKGIGLTLRF